jgi:hypothetical protein
VTITFIAPAAHAARTIGVLAAVLTIAVLLAQPAAAEPLAPIKQRAQAQVDQCTAGEGGTATIEYEYSTVFKGAVTKATVTCKGGNSGNWTCVNTVDSKTCTNPLTRNPESPAVIGGGSVGATDSADPGTSVPDATSPTTGQLAPIVLVGDQGS